MSDSDSKQWAIVEILGRRKLPGRITEARRFGVEGVSVEVLLGPGQLSEPQFYVGASLFSVRPVTQEMALREAGTWQVRDTLRELGLSAPEIEGGPVALLSAGERTEGDLDAEQRIARARLRLQGPSSLLVHHLKQILNGSDVDPVEWKSLPDLTWLNETEEEGLHELLRYLQVMLLGGSEFVRALGMVKKLADELDATLGQVQSDDRSVDPDALALVKEAEEFLAKYARAFQRERENPGVLRPELWKFVNLLRNILRMDSVTPVNEPTPDTFADRPDDDDDIDDSELPC